MNKLSYTVLDLLDKAIFTAEKKKQMCYKVIEDLKDKTPICLLAKVFIKNLDKSIKHYKHLTNELNNINAEVIDFVVYDKISFLINEFNQKMMEPDIENIKSFSKSCLDFQKELFTLYVDIQGRLVRSEQDTKTKAYEIINNLIKDKEKTIKSLEEFIKSYF